MKTPTFWYQSSSALCRLLKPFGGLYAWTVARRFQRAHPYQADIPVICVGNLSVGGTGKTPVCLTLGQMLKDMKVPFAFLNHGYKSRQKGVVVDAKRMTAVDVGDEALLMAAMAPTVVDNRRARGAQLIQRLGVKALIMDDGFQNPSLIKTLSLVVVDGRMGFGNGYVIPAGPLREPVDKGLRRADAVIVAGTDKAGVAAEVKRLVPEMPVLTGHFEPSASVIRELRGKKVLAFAGIGQPEKFFDMLDKAGVIVEKKMTFPDHYFYTRFDLEQVIGEAGSLCIVTTQKDYVKIPRDIQAKITIVDGQFVFDAPEEAEALLKGALNG